jgi:hypothetical protein
MKARLAATIKDWVGSELTEPIMLPELVKYWTAVVRAMITDPPISRNAANPLNMSWMREAQLSGDFTGC